MSPSATLLTLPRELRDEIYGYLLAGEPTESDSDAFIRRVFHTSILRVNKQLHHESEKFLLQKHSFVLLHYVGNQKSFDHEAFAPFLRHGIPIVSRGFRATKPSSCTRLQLRLELKCLGPFYGNSDKRVLEQKLFHSFLICSSDFELVSRMAQWSSPWTQLNAVYVTSTAPARLWILGEPRQNFRSWSERHALVCTDVSFFDRSLHHTSQTSRQGLITNTCRFICTPYRPTISGLESNERIVMERRMTPIVFVFTKMMADLLVTAQYLKSKADGLLAQGDTEGAKCLYTAFLKSYHRSIRPFLVLIRAEILCQDPKCAEYIYRIIELAFNVQLAVICARPLEFSMLDAIKLLEDFFRLFFRKFDNMLPQFHSEIESNLRNAVHLDLLLKYPRFVGVDTIVKRLGNFLKVCPSDERLSHDLNLAKKLQAQAHVSQFFPIARKIL